MKKFAFTLAEVLITLGIIGVVAAMTIPALMNNTACQKFKTGYKKTLATLNQAVRLNSVNYNFDFGSVTNCKNKDTDKPNETASICSIFNGSLNGKYAYSYTGLKTPSGTLYYQDVFNKAAPDTLIKEQGVELYMYTLADGAIFAFHSPFAGNNSESVACTLGGATLQERMEDRNFIKYCIAFIDVNGTTLPNKEVRCSDGKSHSKDIDAECNVPNNTAFVGDVYPVAIVDAEILPASAAAKFILHQAK